MTYSSTAFQFTHLLQRVYQKLEQTKEISATGGTTATIVATGLSDDYQDFSDFDGTVAFIKRDAAGAGAAPEGEYALMTGYSLSTKTMSFATGAFTVAPASGDRVILAQGALYPLYDVEARCNAALQNLGDVPLLDTTLTTASNQTEYDMPSGVKWNQIIKIELQGITTDSNNNQYYEVRPDDVVIPPTIGGTALIVLPQFASGYTIRIWHINRHTELTTYDGDISKAIHPTLAVAACALECAEINRQASQQTGLLEKLVAQYRDALSMHPLTQLNPQIHGMRHWTPGSRVEDKFTYPQTT